MKTPAVEKMYIVFNMSISAGMRTALTGHKQPLLNLYTLLMKIALIVSE